MKIVKRIFILVSLLFVLTPIHSYGANMGDFTSYPPFITNAAIPPNIMLVLDHSGSMLFPAYLPCNGDPLCGSASSMTHPRQSYDPSQKYYGLFDVDKYYTNSSNGMVINSACSDYTDTIGGPGCISGSVLNWATMSRIDVVRKALIGGKALSSQTSTHTMVTEGGSWEYEDNTLGCRFTVNGGVPNGLSISAYSGMSADGCGVDTVHSDFFGDDIFSSKWSAADIGIPIQYAGSQEEFGGTLKVKSEGVQIYSFEDHCRFVYQPITGTSFDIRLQVKSLPNYADLTKAGLMIRRSLAPNDRTIMAMLTNTQGIQFAAREYDGNTHKVYGYVTGKSTPQWVRIRRDGSTFYFYYSDDGLKWNQFGITSTVYQMGETVYVGMATATYADGKIGTFEFDNFQYCTGNCTLGTMSVTDQKIEIPDKARRGVIHSLSDKDYDGEFDPNSPRFGLMTYSDKKKSGCIKVGIEGSNMSSFMAALQNESPVSGEDTNTGEALKEAIKYYKQDNNLGTLFTGGTNYSGYLGCNNSAYIKGPGSNQDPWYDLNYKDFNTCRKSYILLVSDGEWTGSLDPVIPARESHVTDFRAGMDGDQVLNYYSVYAFSTDNRGRNTLSHVGMFGDFDDFDKNDYPFPYDSSNQYPEDPVTSTVDSRAISPPPSKCSLPDPPGNCTEWDKSIDGIPDSFFEATDGNRLEYTLINAILDIIRRASAGTAVSVISTTGEGEGTVYQAYFNSSRFFDTKEIKWMGYLQSLFVDKYGNLRANSYNKTISQLDYGLDEYNICSKEKQDYIVRYYYDPIMDMTMIKYYVDAECDGKYDGASEDLDGDGTLDEFYTPASGTVPVSLENFKDYIWEAGSLLHTRDVNSLNVNEARKIYTTIDGSTPLEFVASNAADLKDFLQADSLENAQRLVNYIRGVDIDGYRSRTFDGHPWKLGDIIYSTPKAVSRPSENFTLIYRDGTYRRLEQKYSKRRTMVYVGANDGMLHAFNGGFYDPNEQRFYNKYTDVGGYSDSSTEPALGEELWAFIPKSALPHLQWLKEPFYTHVSYIDGEPKVSDVRIFKDDAEHPEGWGTILIGSMRYGGKQGSDVKVCSGNHSRACIFDPLNDPCSAAGEGTCTQELGSAYFAIDITDPEQPELLWTFEDPLHLGMTSSYPAIIRTGCYNKSESSATGECIDNKGKWFAVFGSGPTTYEGTSSQPASLYILELTGGKITQWTEGTNYWRKDVTTPTGEIDLQAFMANPIAIDFNLDYDVDVMYVGNTYCPDKTDCPLVDPGTEPSPWAGKMYRINVSKKGESTTPGEWEISTLFGSTTEPLKPITGSASATLDEQGNLLVFFGTGRFLTEDDKLYYPDSSIQTKDGDHYSFYGIKDVCKPWFNDSCASVSVCNGTSAATVSTNPIPSQYIIDVTNKEVSSPVCSNNSSQYCTQDSQCWADPNTPETGAYCDQSPAKNDFRLHLFGDENNKGARDCDALGWKYTFPDAGEQTYGDPLVIGGLVIWATERFNNDICSNEAESFVYAVYYETGTAYEEEVFNETSQDGKITRRKELGTGLPSSVGAFVTGEKSITGFSQTSTGTIVDIKLDTVFDVQSSFGGWKSEKIRYDILESDTATP